MKGYSYPGTSPLKGKKKKARQAQREQDITASIDEATALIKEMPFGPIEQPTTDSPVEQRYNPDEAYFQSLVKATRETPELSNEDIRNPKKRDENDKLLHQKARQEQVINYRKSKLKLNK